MRLPAPVFCLALYLFLPLPGQADLSFMGQATAQPATLTPEQLYLNCRRAMFVRYGQRMELYGGPKLAMHPVIATQVIDECVRRNRWRLFRPPA